MTYFVVADFRAGLDRRKMAVTAPPGTLRTLRDCHVNRGGEVEKRKAWEPIAGLPSGKTKGLAASAGALYTFGDTALATPSPILYQQLVAATPSPLARVLSAQLYNGKIYAIGEFESGAVHHFYDGTRLTQFANRAEAEHGRLALPFTSCMYTGGAPASGSILFRTGVGTADDYDDTAVGSAFFDMSTNAAGAEAITGLANYQGRLAIFTRRTTQIWTFTADPDGAIQTQVLPRIGTTSPRAVTSFADTDVFFLAESGVRSLRTRDQFDSAAMNDVGSPIDVEIAGILRTLTAAEREAIHAEVEPIDGRFWLSMAGVIYAFSYFPGGKVSAWSTYTPPAATDALVVADNRIYARVGDTVYVYGGMDGTSYDATQAVVETGYLNGQQIATWKGWRGIDIAAEGSWEVYASFNPEQPDAEDLIGTLTGPTFSQASIPMVGVGPQVKLRLVSTGSGAAKLGSVVVHYNPQGAS